jgi:molecular chaperone GrpE
MTNNSDLDFKSDDKLKQKTTTNNVEESLETITEKMIIPEDHNQVTNPMIETTSVDSVESPTLIDEKLTEELNAAKKKSEEYYNQMLRIAADADNERKQNSIDMLNSKKNSKKQVLKSILPFLTAINLSFAFAPKNDETTKFISQLSSSLDKLTTDLKSLDIELLIPASGVAFDPVTMQALNNSENENPVVMSLASVGCIIDSQVIQPASVILD